MLKGDITSLVGPGQKQVGNQGSRTNALNCNTTRLLVTSDFSQFESWEDNEERDVPPVNCSKKELPEFVPAMEGPLV